MVAGRRRTVSAGTSSVISNSGVISAKVCSGRSRSGSRKESRRDAAVRVATPNSPFSSVDCDTAFVKELQENGARTTRRTKLICTIGPATSGYEELEELARNGMNVARLNMCHGQHEWHREVIQKIGNSGLMRRPARGKISNNHLLSDTRYPHMPYVSYFKC